METVLTRFILVFCCFIVAICRFKFKFIILKHRKSVAYSLMNALIDSGEQFFLPLFVSAHVSQAEFGIFRLSYMLMRGPVGVLGAAFSSPFIWLFRNRPSLVMPAVYFLVFCSVVGAASGYFLSDLAVYFSPLRHFEPYFSSLRSLTPWLLALMCVSPLTLIPIITGQQKTMMMFALLDCITVLGGAAVFIAKSGLAGLFPLSCLMAICLLLEWLWLRKLIKVGFQPS